MGNKKAILKDKRSDLAAQLLGLKRPEIVTPKFHFRSGIPKGRGILSIRHGAVGYESIVLTDIFLTVLFGDKIAITGENGSGESTLFKALMGDSYVRKSGHWELPSHEDIGYLDQNYQNLDEKKSVLDTIAKIRPDWAHQELRNHLNSFLFRKNEEVNVLIRSLRRRASSAFSLPDRGTYTEAITFG